MRHTTKLFFWAVNNFFGYTLISPSSFLKLIKKYGPDILNELQRRKQRIVKDFPFSEMIESYKQKIKELDKQHANTI